MMRYYQKSLVLILAGALAGCGWFHDSKPVVEGERIAVLNNETAVKPDVAKSAIKITLPQPHRNTEWSQNGGNASHFMGHLESGTQLQGLWEDSFGTGSSKRDFLIATPVIANQTVFAIDAKGIVSAKKLSDGSTLWKRRVKPVNRTDKGISVKGGGIAVADGNVYVTTGFGGVFALNAENGQSAWFFDAGNPIHIAPTVDSNILFVQTIANELFALDAKSGEKLWHYDSEADATTMLGGASPAYDTEQDLLIAAFSNGELRAFKASTGSPLWTDWLFSSKKSTPMATINTIRANPVIAGSVVFAAGQNNLLTAIDIRTGTRIWQRDFTLNNQPWVSGNYLFAVANNSDLIAIEAQSGRVIWSTKIPLGEEDDDKTGAEIYGPILTDNRLIVATSTGYAFAVSPYTGKIMSYVELDDGIEASPIIADGVMLLTTNEADIYAYQ